MRSVVFVAALFLAAPVVAQEQRHQLDTIDPAQAISRAASASPNAVRAVVEFKVQSATKSRGGYYLDSEKDFHAATNLGVMIRPSAMPGLTQKYGEDLKSALVGKTVKIIGQVRRRVVAGGRATATQVEVTHAGQILSVS
ncbi:MAG: hypothetical protein ACTHKE_01340 [Sphingomicrobium sp.]